jgi:cbb3-type cytochrome oxidase subunit 3
VGVNGCTAVEIPESPMYTEDAWYVRKTYVALHTWTYRPEKKKKEKKNKPPLGQRLQMRQYHVSKQRPQKKKESDKAAVLISLQIMTKKR